MEGGNTKDTLTMEGATTDPGTMEYTTTNSASMEGDTTDTGTSMPPTISLPTTSPIRREDCNPGTKESSTSDLREICHNNNAILVHMNQLMKTVDTIKELIKTLPKELYQKAQGDLIAAEKSIPQYQMLHSVLDSAITSSGIPPKSQPKQQKAQKSPDNPKELQPRTEVRSRRNPQLSHQPSYLR